MNRIKSHKKAFTMAELLVTLSIIGVVAAITLPTIRSVMPNKYDAMRKKAEYELEQKVTELVNDDIVYGDREDENGGISRGLRNTYYVKLGDGEDLSYGKDIRDHDDAKRKFCKLLASKFELAPDSEVNCDPGAKFTSEDGTPSFISRDGVEWLIPITNFLNGDGYIVIRTSAAGDSRAPHCGHVIKENITSEHGIITGNCSNGADTFVYGVTPDGNIYSLSEEEGVRTDKIKVRK